MAAAMRLVAFIHTPKSPYSAVYLGYLQLSDSLASLGHEMEIVGPEDFPLLARLHARWYPVALPFFVAAWLWRRRDYDAAFFHSYLGWVANLLGLYRRRTATAFHGLEPLNYAEVGRELSRAGRGYRWPFRLLHGRVLPPLMRLSCRRSAQVLCLNQEERAYLLEHGWVSPSRVHVVAHGVGGEFFTEREPEARSATRLLFVGQWIERKGIAYLVPAFERLARQRPPLELWCVGTLVGEEAVLASFSADIRPRVVVRPTIERGHLPAIYREADVFVFPSLIDGFGVALLEAMAGGLPIVTTPSGWAQDALRDAESCLMVPKRDVDALVAAVERLLLDPGLRRRLGNAARAVAANYRDPIITAQRVALAQQLVQSA